MCRASDNIPQHQKDLQDALESLSAVIVGGEGLLGIGGSARVFQVTVGDNVLALKIVSSFKAHFGKKEIWNLRDVHMQVLCQNKCVPSLVSTCSLPSGSIAILLSPVGKSIQRKADERRHLPKLFKSLSSLHRGGWYHGDARLPNFVICEGIQNAVAIDLVLSKHHNKIVDLDVETDVYRLIASFLGLPGNNMIDNDPKALVSMCNFPDIADAVKYYLDTGYDETAAQKIGVIVARLKHKVKKNLWSLQNTFLARGGAVYLGRHF